MEILFTGINSIIVLLGVYFFKWSIPNLLVIYCYEGFLLAVIVFFTMRKIGGNNLLYKFLPIDKEFFNKQQLTKNKKGNPFFTYGSMLLCYNTAIAIIIYGFFSGQNIKISSIAMLPFIGVTINYLINNLNLRNKLNNKVEFASYLAKPAKNIFIMYFAVIIGGSLSMIFNLSFFIIIVVIVALRLFMDIAVIKNDSFNFNKSILYMHGIKLLKLKP